MQYAAIDIETTGLDPKQDQILQLAMVWETMDSKTPVEDLPYFEALVYHERVTGSPYALALNAGIFEALKSCVPGVTIEYKGRSDVAVYDGADPDMSYDARQWLAKMAGLNYEMIRGRVTAAGKNAAGFDLQFLHPTLKEVFSHRVLDPGSMGMANYTDGEIDNMQRLPGLGNLITTDVTHDALEDARDVVRAIRSLRRRPL